MILRWSKKVEISNLWAPDCFGFFGKTDQMVTFFFKHGSTLLSISEEDNLPQLLYSCDSNEALPLPSRWVMVEVLDTAFLMISDDKGFDLKNNVFSYDIPVQVRMTYNQQLLPEKHYVEAPQHLGEFTIFHKGNCGYICERENTKLWEFTGRAYLYTDIMRWKDRLFFGTGGYGGYFYILDICSGVPLVAIKTGGTRCIAHVNNLCYVLRNEKHAQLLCIDLSDGRLVSQCDLPGIATLDSRMTMIGNEIHVITFNISHSKGESFTWSCIEV